MLATQHQSLCCSLAIAGIGVDLLCAAPNLAAHLARRYAAFPATSTAILSATVALALPSAVPWVDDAATIAGKRADLVGPGYQGWIDLEAGRAELLAAPDAAMMATDYFLRAVYILLGFDSGGMLMHGAGVARDGRGYLFLGPSGTGKTTVARNSPGTMVLNDDLVLALPSGAGWVIHATPFWNPTQGPPSRPASVPLAAIFRLVQARRVFLEPMGAAQGVAELIAHAPLLSLDRSRAPQLLARARHLGTLVPLQRLHFLPDSSFWAVIAPSGY